MKLELGKFEIKDIQFADKSYVENHVLYVNKEEVEALVLEDDKLIGCHLEIAKPGEATRITPVKDVIEPRVKVSAWRDFPRNYRKGITTGWIWKNTCFRWLLRSYSRKNRWIPGRCY